MHQISTGETCYGCLQVNVQLHDEAMPVCVSREYLPGTGISEKHESAQSGTTHVERHIMLQRKTASRDCK